MPWRQSQSDTPAKNMTLALSCCRFQQSQPITPSPLRPLRRLRCRRHHDPVAVPALSISNPSKRCQPPSGLFAHAGKLAHEPARRPERLASDC
jgi:hypothetical protein